MAFTKRFKVPSKEDKRFICSGYGGEYKGILGKPAYFKGSALSNCVGYAFARRQEIELDLTGNDHTLVGIPKGRLIYAPTSAYAWYGYTHDGYERSKNVPKEGSVVVWKNNKKLSGHVAIVEEIGKNYILISESGYGGYVFRTSKIFKNYCLITAFNPKTGKYTTSKHWNYKYRNGQILKTDNTFLGYIYPPKEVVKEPTPQFKVGEKVRIKSKKYVRYVIKVDTENGIQYLLGINEKKLTGWYEESLLERV